MSLCLEKVSVCDQKRKKAGKREKEREREREMPSLGAIVALGRTSTRCKRSEVEL